MGAKTRACLTPLALLCFVVGGAIPRPTAYAHHHAGDATPHSHGAVLWVPPHEHSDGASLAHDHAAHHHHDATPLLSGARTRDHVHTQEPFHRIAMRAIDVASTPRSAPAGAACAMRAPPAPSPVAPRSRGPPLVGFC